MQQFLRRATRAALLIVLTTVILTTWSVAIEPAPAQAATLAPAACGVAADFNWTVKVLNWVCFIMADLEDWDLNP